MLRPSHPNVFAVLVGNELVSNLAAEAEKMGISDRVIFYGPTSKVAEVLSHCRFGVFPSQYEGHPIALCEMMAAGLPVAASDITANVFVTEGGKGAFLFNHSSALALADTMSAMINDPEAAIKKGQAGKEIVSKRFSAAKMFNEHLAVYAQVSQN